MATDHGKGYVRVWRNDCVATLATDQSGLGIVERGAVVARDGRIVFAGEERDLPGDFVANATAVDCEGRWTSRLVSLSLRTLNTTLPKRR